MRWTRHLSVFGLLLVTEASMARESSFIALLDLEPDSDGDRVADFDDYCPRTPAGKPVWTVKDATDGKALPHWVGCAGPGDPYDPSYRPPARNEDSLLRRIAALYDQGTAANLGDFSPELALQGKRVFATQANLLKPVQLISVDVGDEVTKTIRYAALYATEYYGKAISHESAQADLLQTISRTWLSPLVVDSQRQALSNLSGQLGYQVCTFYRQLTLDDGQRILVIKQHELAQPQTYTPHRVSICGHKLWFAAYVQLP